MNHNFIYIVFVFLQFSVTQICADILENDKIELSESQYNVDEVITGLANSVDLLAIYDQVSGDLIKKENLEDLSDGIYILVKNVNIKNNKVIYEKHKGLNLIDSDTRSVILKELVIKTDGNLIYKDSVAGLSINKGKEYVFFIKKDKFGIFEMYKSYNLKDLKKLPLTEFIKKN